MLLVVCVKQAAGGKSEHVKTTLFSSNCGVMMKLLAKVVKLKLHCSERTFTPGKQNMFIHIQISDDYKITELKSVTLSTISLFR